MAIIDNSTVQPRAVNDPLCSSDSVWYKDNEFLSVSDKFDQVEAAIAAKADTSHTHTGYASQSDLTTLEDIIDTKADSSHTHTEYASSTHTHDEYATMTALDTLENELDGKANTSHTHTEYAASSHSHDEYSEIGHTHSNYSETTHTHDDYASVSHTHTASEIGAAISGHNHDNDYATIDHSHTNYATTTALGELSTTVSGKANASHTHNDTYYTETEIDTKLANKADSSHTHTGVYDANGAAASALTSANAYTDSKIDALVGEGASTTLDTIGEISSAIEDNQDAIDLLNSAIANKANVSHTHTISNITNLQTTLDGKASTTHSHVISNITGLQSALDGKAASGHTHSDVYTETEIDTLLEGKANSSHTHTIANITNLQTTLDGKASTSHGTHVSYSTTVPVMDGTASVGTAATVARSDHKHPTDTSRAAQTSLDSHTSNKSNPHGVTLAQLGLTATAAEINKLDGVTATTAELNILDGVTATATELNYIDGVTSNVQTQLNGKAASSHTHNYAGSSSVGGAATSANKLNTDAGSATQPVYFANGIPVKTTYTLGASVPAGAKFTDTTYGVATTSANGLMSATDKSKLNGMVLATVSEVETYLAI